MSDQQTMAEFVDHVAEKPPSQPLDFYIIVAWWKGGWWRVSPDHWTDHEEALRQARLLADGWSHRKVVRIYEAELPRAKEE